MNDSLQAHQDILIIDDTPDNLSILSQMLKKRGYIVRTAISGKLALSSIHAAPPALILLDIMLPDIDGYAICRQLQEHEHTKNIPVIFLSGLHEPEHKIQAFESGGVDYITKPFRVEEVGARVETHLTIRRLHRQIQKKNALLHEQNVRFQILEEASFEGIIIHDGVRVLEVNQRFEEMFGYRRTEIVGKPPLNFIAPAFRENMIQRIESRDEASYQVEGMLRDGTAFPVEVQSRTMPYQGQEVLVATIRDLRKQRQLEQENHALRTGMQERYRFGEIIGKSRSMLHLYELIAQAAATEYGVIVYGESGTGKELVARTIHAMSSRRQQMFVPVNCGAITETLFEREFFGHRKGAFTGADHDKPGFFDASRRGTLFLDEVGELSSLMQVKLLRALESGGFTPVGDTEVKHTDARLIAATNRNPQELLQNGLFREDFFYRIHVIAITISPLRERREDIPLLIEHILKEESPGRPTPKLSGSIIEHLTNYDWPGNVRQLQNTLQHYLTTGELLVQGQRLQDISPPGFDREVPEVFSLSDALSQVERQIITQVLSQHRGNRTATASHLGITRRALYNKLEKYSIN
ncbi:sigma-54-dependent Fis family transcriptional regulator [candidate division KSB3 bacterium]|uniref:Sigma-54-dependent Fis family transcriptional regulator n=1 Tax=candidate division KSB3 bacterium TaxID=2044937 RepID=A0A2G6KE12_9BACT|nr:MAG: sigma-54-dependent Fis family transcriptional regulator [candidate division KSB3 bacterium]